MKLSELIAHVGDENVQIQNLNRDFDEVKVRGEKATISFHTEKEKALDFHAAQVGAKNAKWCPLVVWLPRDRMTDVTPTKGGQDGKGT